MPSPCPTGPLADRLAELALAGGLTVTTARSTSLGCIVQSTQDDDRRVTVGGWNISELTGRVVGAWHRDLTAPPSARTWPLLGITRVYHELHHHARHALTADLHETWWAENDLEDAGELTDRGRLTCYACRTWAGARHGHHPLTGALLHA